MADFPGEVVVLLARRKSGRKDALRTGVPEWTLAKAWLRSQLEDQPA